MDLIDLLTMDGLLFGKAIVNKVELLCFGTGETVVIVDQIIADLGSDKRTIWKCNSEIEIANGRPVDVKKRTSKVLDLN